MRSPRRYTLILLLPVAVLLFVALFVDAPRRPPHPHFAGDRFVVIAHRGGRGLGPEETLSLFRRSAELGVDVLEMDVWHSADGVLVLCHDRRLDRTTDGSGPIDSLSLAELKELDAGYDWSPDDGQSHPYRGQGIRIPTFEEVLRAFPDQRLLVEIKPDDRRVAEDLCSTTRRFGALGRLQVASFHDEMLEVFRTACPEVPTSGTSSEVAVYALFHWLRLDALHAPGFDALQVPRRAGPVELVDRRFVETARRRGLPVHVWTVNPPEEMERFIDLEVDGLITDRPDLLIDILRRRGMR